MWMKLVVPEYQKVDKILGMLCQVPGRGLRGVQYWIEDLIFEKFIRQNEGIEVKWGDLADHKTDQ